MNESELTKTHCSNLSFGLCFGRKNNADVMLHKKNRQCGLTCVVSNFSDDKLPQKLPQDVEARSYDAALFSSWRGFDVLSTWLVLSCVFSPMMTTHFRTRVKEVIVNRQAEENQRDEVWSSFSEGLPISSTEVR
eukprot:scaffold29247_cov69-Cyclotella_meneghiniana.AAC.5